MRNNDFSEKDAAEALDLVGMITRTGAWDPTDPHDRAILAQVGAFGAHLIRYEEDKVDDVDGFVEANAPTVEKLLGRLGSEGGTDGGIN